MLLAGIVLAAATLTPLAVHAREEPRGDDRNAGRTALADRKTEKKLRGARNSAEQLAADIERLDEELERLKQQVVRPRTEDAVARGKAARAEAGVRQARASVARSFARHQARARSAYMMDPAAQMSALVDS